MKKIIALLLVLTLCVGLFAGCKKDEPETPTVQDAMDYLVNSYRSDEGKKTPADYKMPAQVPIGDVKFPVTWECSLDTVEIVLEDGLYTIKVPAKNDAEVEYTLTATVKDAEGNSLTKDFKRVLPVYDNAASVTEPEEGVAYKLYMVQANAGKTVFALGEMQGDKYIKTDIDPKKGVDFYAEQVEGGYKFYTEINGVKNYVHAHTTTGEDGKVSKYIGYATESDCVYYYVAAVKAWFVKIENIEYVVGTYSDYTTICISESSYISADNTGVSQFPVALMEKEAAEALAPSEGPEDPTVLSTIPEILEKANALENSAQTPEKYLVQGVITEIKSEQYGNMYIKDEAGNELYIYGVYSKDGSARYDAMNPQPKVGDTVTLMGVLSKYNDAPQMKNAWVQELVAGEGGDAPVGPTDKPTTPADIVDAAYALEGGATLAGGPYTLTGKIISIDTEWSEQYGNISVSIVVDGKEDKPIQAFRLKGEGASTLKVGDVITVTGQLLNYVNKDGASKIEFDSGCTLDSVTSASGGETPVDPPVDNKPTTPTTPTTPAAGLSTDKPYFIQGQNQNGTLYFNGKMNNGRIDGASAKEDAVTVKLEKGAADGEYYIYFMAGSTKTYIAGVLNDSSKAASFVFTTTKDDSCVWLIDANAKTIVSKSLGTRGIATQNTSSYTTFSTYASSNFEKEEYTAAWFVEAGKEQAGSADTGSSGSSGSSGSGNTGTTATEPESVKTPEIGKAYKLGMWQSTKGETYYFTGAMSGYYGATSTTKSEGVDVYLEDAGNGAFYIYFMEGSTKNYIYGEANGTYLNFKYGNTKGIFTWNAEKATFMTTIGEETVFMGTYSNYVTFGMSKESVLDTSYPAHLYN